MTTEETWIHHFTSESNRQSAEWTAAGESHPKATKEANISRQDFGLCILGCVRYFVHWLPWEKKNHILYYWSVWRKESPKQCPKEEGKCSFTKTVPHVKSRSQRWKKLHELHFELLPHPCYFPDLPLATTGCGQTSKECSRERDLSPMKNWHRKLKAYFKAKDKSFYKKSIILLKSFGITVSPEKSRILLKIFLLVKSRTYWVICHITHHPHKILNLKWWQHMPNKSQINSWSYEVMCYIYIYIYNAYNLYKSIL